MAAAITSFRQDQSWQVAFLLGMRFKQQGRGSRTVAMQQQTRGATRALYRLRLATLAITFRSKCPDRCPFGFTLFKRETTPPGAIPEPSVCLVAQTELLGFRWMTEPDRPLQTGRPVPIHLGSLRTISTISDSSSVQKIRLRTMQPSPNGP